MGENIAARFVKRHGFRIIIRNYRKKWGELDIVAFKDGILHVFEVKSTKVSHFTEIRDRHRLEDNVHNNKLARIRRTVQTFLVETGRGVEVDFYFHVITVKIDARHLRNRICWIKNVVL